jgi:hypothetical protein
VVLAGNPVLESQEADVACDTPLEGVGGVVPVRQ